MRKKFPVGNLLLAAVALVILVGLFMAFIAQPVESEVAAVTRGPMEVSVEQEGETRIRERYQITAPLDGQLQRITLREGDPVLANNTLLATILPPDPSLLDARAKAQAQARVGAAQAALEMASSERKRVQQMHDAQTAGDKEYTDAVQTEVMRENELEVAKAALLLTQPATAATQFVDPPSLNLFAPEDGKVLRVLQKSAGPVSAGQSLLEIGNPADLEVQIDVLSTDAVKILPNAKVRFEGWGGDHPLYGKVRLVEPSGFTKVSTLGVEEQRVWVIADFDDPPASNNVADAYRVDAFIVTWESPSTLQLPAGALFRDGPDWTVFKLQNGRAVQTHVKIGQNNGAQAQVLAGLSENDQVILHPSDKIKDGSKITPRDNNPK